MRWILISLLYLSLLIACDNSIQVNAELREVPVAFALLDVQDSVHYLRVERLFSEEGISALELAQDPQRIYYNEGEIEIELREMVNGDLVATHSMTRVDGDSIGIPKDEGIFADSPNILYRYTGILNPDTEYELSILNTQNDKKFVAKTILIQDFVVIQPQTDDFPLDFADTGKFTVEWISAKGGKSYEGILDFYYTETNEPSGLTSTKCVEWKLFGNMQSQTTNGFTVMRRQLENGTFFNIMNNAIEPAENLERTFSHADLRITAGGEEIYLLYLNNLANLGISEMFISPFYSNFDGGGLGIFSSRFEKTIPNVNITDRTIDSLACGRFTHDLGFTPSPTAGPDCQ